MEASEMMKIGVLTSSRADYGIYQPLLKKLKNDSFFKLEIIAFGTHVSKFHGYTVNHIEEDGFEVVHRISTVLTDDSEEAISTSYGLTVTRFASFWNINNYDLVFCLGDRYEMSAAVQAGIPLGVKFAHIHGGETTLGAIDNVYRHQISHASVLHFTSTEQYAKKISAMLGSDKGLYTTGALSLDGVAELTFPDESKFRRTYKIPDGEFILITFHPETVSAGANLDFAVEMKKALSELIEDFSLVITMPNADTLGSLYREQLYHLKNESMDKVVLVENFGRANYFAAMNYCRLLLGNTSSGIIEAASFNKYVVNVGDRQKGRVAGENVFHCKFSSAAIVSRVNEAVKKGCYTGGNIYFSRDPADKIIRAVKNTFYATF